MNAPAVTLNVTLTPEQIRAIVGPELRAVLREREQWMTIKEAARHARRSRYTIMDWIEKAGLPKYDGSTGRGGRVEVLILRRELDAFLAKRRIKVLARPEFDRERRVA